MKSVWSVSKYFDISLLSVIALIFTEAVGTYVTHPGVHALISICLLDIVMWKRNSRHILQSVVILGILNSTVFWAIFFAKFDWVENWSAILCLVYTVLLVLVPNIHASN